MCITDMCSSSIAVQQNMKIVFTRLIGKFHIKCKILFTSIVNTKGTFWKAIHLNVFLCIVLHYIGIVKHHHTECILESKIIFIEKVVQFIIKCQCDTFCFLLSNIFFIILVWGLHTVKRWGFIAAQKMCYLTRQCVL